MTHAETFAQIATQKDGPIKKFQLIKLFGAAIRQGGVEPKEMSCTELEARISEMLKA